MPGAAGVGGRAGYDPDLLLGVLLYGYAVGVRSTRAIERLCATDVAFRVACAQDVPDHSTLARFRQDHEAAFVELFARVLEVAARAGLGQFGTIAIDGTKIPGNASLDANRSSRWVHAQAAAVVAEAAAVDAGEDAAEAAAPPGRPPAGWSDPQVRRARIAGLVAELESDARSVPGRARQQARQQRAAELEAGVLGRGRWAIEVDRVAAAQLRLEQARAAQQAKLDARAARRETGQRLSGPPPIPVEEHWRVKRARAGLADEQARVEQRANQAGLLQPSTRRIDSGRRGGPRVNLTDPQSRIMKVRRGWVQGYNAQLAVSADQLIVACTADHNPVDVAAFVPMMRASVAATEHLAAVTGRDTTIGTVLADAGYASHDNLTAAGPDRLIALGKSANLHHTAATSPVSGPPDPTASPRDQMAHRLATPEGAALYKRRGATVEPGIGNLKKLLPRFSRRGRTAANAELHLAAAAFNLLKIHRMWSF